MAKGKVKKGFGVYLFVLLLAVVATFLIIVTVLLFSPFKNILGFKYFVFKEDHVLLTETSEQESPFNFETIENINIDCSFAKVKVERITNIDTYAIRFENYMSGFAREDHDTDFSYEVYFANPEKTDLNVKVHEPEGFLYFNKNLTISVLVSTKVSYTLENTALNITNTSGTITIGNSAKVINLQDDSVNYITIGDLNIKTNTGKVIINPYINETMQNLFIKTDKSKIIAKRDIKVAKTCQLYGNNSDFDLKNLVVESQAPVMFGLKDSTIYSPYVKGNVQLSIKNGYFDIDKFEGSLSANDAIDQMSKSSINILEFDGYLSFPYANSSNINLGSVGGSSEIYIHSTKGDVNIKDMRCNVAKIETTSGNVQVETSGRDIDIQTTSGKIDVKFEGDTILNQIDLISNSGKVDLKVKGDLAFKLDVRNAKNEYRNDNNVQVSWLDNLTENPLSINGGARIVGIKTNGRVDISLI